MQENFFVIMQRLGKALIYYFLFRFFISRFNLATLGREDNEETVSAVADSSDLATAYLAALGERKHGAH